MQFKKSIYLLLLLVLILTISLIIFYLLNNKQKNNIENFGPWNFRKLSKDTINRDVEDKYYKLYNRQKKVTDNNNRIKMLDMLKKQQRRRELNQLKLNKLLKEKQLKQTYEKEIPRGYLAARYEKEMQRKLKEANTYDLRNQIYKDYSPSKYGYGTIKKTNNSSGSLRGLFGDWLFSG